MCGVSREECMILPSAYVVKYFRIFALFLDFKTKMDDIFSDLESLHRYIRIPYGRQIVREAKERMCLLNSQLLSVLSRAEADFSHQDCQKKRIAEGLNPILSPPAQK